MRKLICLATSMVLLFSTTVFAQPREVTGKVTDVNGVALNGATVKVKNSRSGTSADVNGVFKLNVEANTVIVVSAVGYETKELNLGTQTSFTIPLFLDTRPLSEVVVTGTGVATSRRKIGISVETVTADKLPQTPTVDIGSALVGKVAGAEINTVNGSPGQPVQILLRGINTLQGGTTPLILLDGVQVSAGLEALDLSMIEKIEIVQGPAAASIYGAQGANGVIQLFSKKGKLGKTNIDIASSIALNQLINASGMHKARMHSFETNGNNEVIDGNGDPLVFDPDYSYYTNNLIWNSLAFDNNNNKLYNANLQYHDHYKEFFGDAYTYNNVLSINGAKDRFDYNITASHSRQNTVFQNNGKYSRSNLSANFGVEIFKNFKFRSNTQLIYTNNTQVDPTGRNMLYAINNSRPFADYFTKSPDGNYGAYYGDAVGVNGYNFNYVTQNLSVDDQKLDIVQSFSGNYKFPKFVELDVKYGLNYGYQEVVQNIGDQSTNLNADLFAYWVEYYPPYWTSYGVPSNKDETGELDHFQYKNTFTNFLSSATIRFDFQKDFHMKIPLKSSTYVGYDYRKDKRKRYISYGLDAPPYTPYTADQMSIYQVPIDDVTPFTTYGYIVSQRFEWGEIFGVSGGFRSDYSSAFGRGSKPFTFPRGDAYLRLSAFDFWKGGISNVISEWKLRGAYGQAGIQPGAFDRYVTLLTPKLGSSNAFVLQTKNSNPDLRVEVSHETEIGTDIAINGSKGSWLRNFNVSATYWWRASKDVIFATDVAPSTGTGSLLDNAFALASKGLQASLNISVLQTKNFNWNFTTNFAKQTSKITSVKGQEVVVLSYAGSSSLVLRPGEKVGQLFGYLGLHSVDEIDPSTGNPYIDKADQGDYTVASNGWVVDKSNRQPYFTPRQYSFGDPNPKFNMSFINEIDFKGFIKLGFQWDWIHGSHLYNQTKEWMYRDGIHGDYDTPITIDGQTGAWTSFYRGVYAQVSRNGTKSYFYEDASFWRLRNVSLAVDFSRFVRNKFFQRLQLVLSGRNIATITDYTGMDPEINSGAINSAFDRGVDHNSIPNIKSYQVGLNLGF